MIIELIYRFYVVHYPGFLEGGGGGYFVYSSLFWEITDRRVTGIVGCSYCSLDCGGGDVSKLMLRGGGCNFECPF